MRNMLRFLKGYEKESILAPLFKMLEACFELLVPLVVANIIDVGIKNGDLAYIGKQCGLMVLLAVVGMASSLTAQYFAAKAALGYGTALRGALFRHIDTLSYTELDGIGTPTLVTRITSDVNQLQNGVNMTLRLLMRCPFIVIGALILAFVISPTMGFWFVLVTLAISLVVWLIMRVTVPQYHAAQNTLDKVTLLTRENYVGARVVRAFARQDDEIADFTAVNDKLKTFQLTAGRISALMTPLTYLIVNLGVIAILMRGGLQVNSGALTQGEIIIIDTMQKIREVGGEAYSYASDYEIIGRLKQFADKHCICVLTVHHTRKQPAGDSFEMISGTTGLLGCADGSLLMQKKKRTALEATIDVVGRDQQDQILYLKKDADTQIWNLEKLENELHKEPPDHVLEAVSRLVSADQPVWTGSPSELAGAVHAGMAANALSKYLNVKSGRLLDEYHVRYENKVRHEGRRITLTFIAENE